MAFDPNLPAPNSRIRSAELRQQFNGLKALIDTLIPIGVALPWFPHLSARSRCPRTLCSVMGRCSMTRSRR